LSVPHAGRDYPAELHANLRVPPAELLRLEDRYADRLVQPAIGAGFPVIVAHRARAWIDLNRAESDFDAQMISDVDAARPCVPSAKTRGGLGLVPRRLAICGEIWRKPWTQAGIDARIADCHRPFHNAVADTLASLRSRFGVAILLDVHSMPPLESRLKTGLDRDTPPRIVLGDRFGRSAASVYAEIAMAHVKGRGLAVALNTPYSGDFILETHGQPRRGIHALQLEVDRSLYLDSYMREPSAGLASVASLVLELAQLLADQATDSHFAEAAE
jgi:N-formylglutamate amidohydrolase